MNMITALAALLIGVLVGGTVVGLAEALGFAGWLAGVLFSLLVFAFIYVSDKLLGFELRHITRLIARMGKIESREVDAELRDNENRRDYYGFFIGTVLGVVASVIWSPSVMFDALPF